MISFLQITSQNQYLEDFVGEPFVHTFDVNDKEKLRDILRKIKESKVTSRSNIFHMTKVIFAYVHNSDGENTQIFIILGLQKCIFFERLYRVSQ